VIITPERVYIATMEICLCINSYHSDKTPELLFNLQLPEIKQVYLFSYEQTDWNKQELWLSKLTQTSCNKNIIESA
jgi:hypothetical protein